LQEALTLAESYCSLIKQRSTDPLVVLTKKRIAMIEFGAMNVVRALSLFNEIRIDFHEVRRIFVQRKIESLILFRLSHKYQVFYH
jgi:hypothetical protein